MQTQIDKLNIGHRIRFEYQKSDGSVKTRIGEIVKIHPDYIILDTSDGFRSFRIAQMYFLEILPHG